MNRRTPVPAHFVQMLRSPDELHVAIKISNEKSAYGKVLQLLPVDGQPGSNASRMVRSLPTNARMKAFLVPVCAMIRLAGSRNDFFYLRWFVRNSVPVKASDSWRARFCRQIEILRLGIANKSCCVQNRSPYSRSILPSRRCWWRSGLSRGSVLHR